MCKWETYRSAPTWMAPALSVREYENVLRIFPIPIAYIYFPTVKQLRLLGQIK